MCIQVISGSGRDRGVGIDREERKIEWKEGLKWEGEIERMGVSLPSL